MSARIHKGRSIVRIGKARLTEMIEENLAVPFKTTVVGVQVIVQRVDLDRSEQIIAVCRRGRLRQSLSILDLPLPTPPPDGADWIEAYRRWRAESR
jgi:hypothetical protein